MKKIKPPKIVVVVSLTTITIIFWVFYSLYNVLTKNPPLKVPEDLLAPINPELDTETLDSISERVFFEKEEINIILTPTPTPVETTIPTPPTPTTTVEEIEEATPTATISPL